MSDYTETIANALGRAMTTKNKPATPEQIKRIARQYLARGRDTSDLTTDLREPVESAMKNMHSMIEPETQYAHLFQA